MRDDIGDNDSRAWAVAANWSPYGVPGAKDTVTIANGDETHPGTPSVRGFNLSDGNIANGIVTVTGTGSWSGGEIFGVLRIADGATFTVSGDGVKQLNGYHGYYGDSARPGRIDNAGTVRWMGAGNINGYYGTHYNNTYYTGSIVNTGTISVPNGAILSAGGSGFIVNEGTVAVREGVLRVVGNYSQKGSGTLDLSVGGTTAGTGYAQLETTGTAALGGNLRLLRRNSFTAVTGDTFQPLSYGARTNQFATVSVALGRHRQHTPTYSASNLTLAIEVNPPVTNAPTATGTNVTAVSDTPNDLGTVEVTFNNVTSAGTTTFTGIDPHSAGAAPAGMTIPDNYPAQEITTTATVSAPITVTFNVADLNLSAEEFDRLRVLHGEGGVLVNRTFGRNFSAGTITARTTSLSPFIIARTNTPPLNLAPVADTWVQGAEASRNTNYGASTEMQVKRTFNAGSGRSRRGFLRFDTSSVAGEVAGARLRLYARLTDANLPPTPMIIQKVTDTTWSEMTMTWNNQPLTASPNALAQITVAGAGGAWYEFDLTDFIRAERAAGRTTVSFRLINVTATGNSGVFFTAVNTKEAATNKPYLSIEQ